MDDIFKTNEQLDMEAAEAKKLILSTKKINVDKAHKIIQDVYRLFEHPAYKCPEEVVYCQSPFEVMKRTSPLTRRTDNARYQSNSPAYRVLGTRLNDHERTMGIGGDLANSLFNNLEAGYRKFMIKPDCTRFVRRITIWGNWSALDKRGQLSNMSYMRKEHFKADLDLRANFAKYAGITSVHHHTIYFSERPTLIKLRNDIPHCDDGPAMRWPDGYVIYAWKGIPIPPQWIEDKNLQAKHFMKIRNAEQRRCYLEIYAHKYGTEAVLKDLNAIEIAVDHPMCSFSRRILEFGGSRYVHVQNGTLESDGSRREFLLRIPGTERTPSRAISWGYGIGERFYTENVRT